MNTTVKKERFFCLLLGFALVCFGFPHTANAQTCKAGFSFQVNGLAVSFTDTSTNTGINLLHFWSFGDGSNSQDKDPIHTYNTNGSYNVRLIIIDSATCRDTVFRRVCLGCVLPGDADNDGVVGNKDVLYVGLAFGAVGPVRNDTTTTPSLQAASAWISSVGVANFITGANIKHADCDGNGVVNRFDLRPIKRNYNQQVIHKTSGNDCIDLNDVPLYFEILDSIQVGAFVNLAVKLGTNQLPALGVYGIAYTVNYDSYLIKSDTVFIDYGSSLFGNLNDIISLNQNFYAEGKIETAISRIDHNNVDIIGTIGVVNFVMEDNLAQKTSLITEILNLSFSEIFLLDKNGNEIPVCSFNDSSVVFQKVDDTSSGGGNDEKHSGITIYPNPAKGMLFLKSDEPGTVKISLFNILGKELMKLKISGDRTYAIHVSEFPSGIYFLSMLNENNSVSLKIEIEN